MSDLPPQPISSEGITDRVHPFMLDESGLRGRLVRMGPLLDEILGRHPYPQPVAQLLGEAIILGTVLANGLKYEGIFTLQLKGDGRVSMLMMDITSAGQVRAYARYDETAEYGADVGGQEADAGLAALMGKGYLAFTVDQGADTDRYQGIVELKGETLSDSVQHYFRQSEQVDTGITASVSKTPTGWFGSGMAIQRLPERQSVQAGNLDEDDWRRAMVLMGSVKPSELADPTLDPNTLLFRLFHEDGVRVFVSTPLVAECRCSTQRIGQVLASLPPEELADLAIEGKASVTCEFCNQTREFPLSDVAKYRIPG